MKKLVLTLCLLMPGLASALGNHPESSVCSPEKPYQAICTHSLHSLEGWYGQCFSNEVDAQKDADKHASTLHQGQTRWTGVKKAKFKGGSGY